MSDGFARALVRAATAVIADAGVRARYREQWLADVDGAAELGMRPTRVALGAAAAAVRLAVTEPRSLAALTRAPLLPAVGPEVRRGYGLVQVFAAFPYVWALAFFGYARLRLGLPGEQVLHDGHDPKDLLVTWVPLSYWYTPVMLWVAAGGWVVAAVLAPVGPLLAAGGRGWARWLPVVGTLAAVLATAVGLSDFGEDLRIWLLD
jgi:hypothetical protein